MGRRLIAALLFALIPTTTLATGPFVGVSIGIF